MDTLPPALQNLPVRLRWNNNRRILVSLRRQKDGSLRLSLHPAVLSLPEAALMDLRRFVLQGGRGQGGYPALQAGLRGLQLPVEDVRPLPGANDERLAHLPVLGTDFDVLACYTAIHARFFPHLSRPPLHLGRDRAQAQLRSLRFASYHRQPAHIVVHPRLLRPWVAVLFVEHVLHHELCHHAQACAPVRGETPHSKRFRAWERGFPELHVARAWERAHLAAFLAPQ